MRKNREKRTTDTRCSWESALFLLAWHSEYKACLFIIALQSSATAHTFTQACVSGMSFWWISPMINICSSFIVPRFHSIRLPAEEWWLFNCLVAKEQNSASKCLFLSFRWWLFRHLQCNICCHKQWWAFWKLVFLVPLSPCVFCLSSLLQSLMPLTVVKQMTTACPAPPCPTLHPGHTPTGPSPRATQTTAASGTHLHHLSPHRHPCHRSSNWGPETAIERRTCLTCKSQKIEAEKIALPHDLVYYCVSLQQ